MREILTMLDLHPHQVDEAKGRHLYVTTNPSGDYIVCYNRSSKEESSKGGVLVAELTEEELWGKEKREALNLVQLTRSC